MNCDGYCIYEVSPNTSSESLAPWINVENGNVIANPDISSVNFEASFEDFKPTSTYGWFYYLSNLTVSGTNLSHLNTSETKNMAYMFAHSFPTDCPYAETCQGHFLGFPNGFGSAAKDMNHMFSDTGSVTVSIFGIMTLPDGFGSQAEDMSYMFNNAVGLESGGGYMVPVIFPDYFGQNATDMSYMFNGAVTLGNVEFPAKFGSAAENMNHMFTGTKRLESISLPDGFGGNAKDMSYMFSACDISTPDSCLNNPRYTTLALPVGFGSKAENMEGMFYYHSNLAQISYRDGDNTIENAFPAEFGNLVENTSVMFSHTSGITTLKFPEDFAQNATEMQAMFNGATTLEHIYVPYGTDWCSDLTLSECATKTQDMFTGASLLPNYDNAGNRDYKDRHDGIKAHIGGKVIQNGTDQTTVYGYFEYIIPKAILETSGRLNFVYDTYTVNEVKSNVDNYIANYEATHGAINHYSCSGLCVFEVPQNTSSTSQVPWSNSDASIFMSNISSVNFDTSFKDFKPTSTNGWFRNLNGLENITNLENLDTSETKYMDYMFEHATSLNSLTLPAGFGQNALSMRDMFKGATYLNSLTLPAGFGQNAWSMTGMFEYASALEHIYVHYGTDWCSDLTLSECATKTQDMFFGAVQLPNYYNTDNGSYKDRHDGIKAHIGGKVIQEEETQTTVYGYFEPIVPKAILESSGRLNFVYDIYSVDDVKNDVDGYKTNYIATHDEIMTGGMNCDGLCIFKVPMNATEGSPAPWIVMSDDPTGIDFQDIQANPNIQTVNFEESFKDFKPTSTYSWFHYLTSLTEITNLENLDTSKTTNMDRMFMRAINLSSLTLPAGFGKNALTMEGTFSHTQALTTLNIPNDTTNPENNLGVKATNMMTMFSYTSIDTLNLPDHFGKEALDTNNMFIGAYIAEINIPNDSNPDNNFGNKTTTCMLCSMVAPPATHA